MIANHIRINQSATPSPMTPLQNTKDNDAKASSTTEKSKDAVRVNLSHAAQKGESSGGASASYIDAAIEKIKEQIKALQKQLAAIEGRQDESALAMQKQLQNQIMVLNGKLMELMATKAKQGAGA